VDVEEIGDAILETKPDVAMVAGWHSRSQVRAIAACNAHGVPLIYRGDTHLAMRPSGVPSFAWRLKTRARVRKYSAYLAVGSRAPDYRQATGAAPTSIFASPPSGDNAFFAPTAEPHLDARSREAARRAFGCSPDEFLVLYVGRINGRKRLDDAIEEVAGRGPSAVLLVAGCGDRMPEMQAWAIGRGARVVWSGFLNQRELGRAYAAADCLVLPSVRESWGLVVNEALATGLPAVVSEAVGCAPDLVGPGETGETFRGGAVGGVVTALERIRARGGRSTMGAACRARVARFSHAIAARGLVAAAQSVAARRAPRVIACCGSMVVVSGLERMTFEVLRVIRERGGTVHCIVNGWENHRIVPMATAIGASWSTGFYHYSFSWRTRNPIRHVQSMWDIRRKTAGLLRDAIRFRPTQVFVPEYTVVIRNAPALGLLRLFGVQIVFRIGNAPERGAVYELLWRRLLPPFVTTFVPNSRFGYSRLQDTGVPARKITLVRNALSRRTIADGTDEDVVGLAAARRTLLTAGQIAPFKGTHLAVDAALSLIAEGEDVQAIIAGAIPIWPLDLVAYVNDLRARVARAGAA